MPELAEIHRFCLLINAACADTVFRPAIVHNPSHVRLTNLYDITYLDITYSRRRRPGVRVTPPMSIVLFSSAGPRLSRGSCKLHARVRGKELALMLTRVDSDLLPVQLVWNFGLVGRFIVSSPNKVPPYALVTWIAQDNSLALSYVDMQKMGKWRFGDFDRKRSPDPVLDHFAFVQNILTGLEKKPHLFKKPIGEILLNQDFFNGIGNYLRAEVLHRACISPMAMADSVLGDLCTFAPSYSFENITIKSPKSLLLIYLCRAVPLEVLEKGLNKYGTKEELEKFTLWLRVYNKDHFIMSGGRKLYCLKSPPKTPDLPALRRSPPSSYAGEVYPSDPRPEADEDVDNSNLENVPKPLLSNPYSLPQTANLTPKVTPVVKTTSLQLFQVDHLAVFGKGKDFRIQVNSDVLARLPLSFQPLRLSLQSNPDLSNTAIALVLVNALHRLSHLQDYEKDTLKTLALTQSEALQAVVQAFFISGDVDDCVDSCKRLYSQGLPPNYALHSGASNLTATSEHSSSPSPTAITTNVQSTALITHSNVSVNAPHGLTDPEWIEALSSEFQEPYFKKILNFVAQERKNKEIFPAEEDVFTAFNYTPLSQVKVVILGQDPYFNPGQAHGLCFSVQKGVKVPPSLLRIFKVLETTIPGFQRPRHGYLGGWAKQGVLMLNATLTVESGKANSHEKCGWQRFTDSVIRVLNKRREGLIYFLWGGFAQKKGALVDVSRHTVLMCAHPSPMAGIEFNSCDHFAKANQLLVSAGKNAIDWSKCD